MSTLDRSVRLVAGGLLGYFGLIAQTLSDSNLINITAGAFGSTNVIAAISGICPGYLLFRFSTKRQKSSRPDATQHNEHVSFKLMLAVLVPVLCVLCIFVYLMTDLSSDLNHRYQRDQARAATSIGLHLTSMTHHGQHMDGTHDRQFFDRAAGSLTALIFHSQSGHVHSSPFQINLSGLEAGELLKIPLANTSDSTEPAHPSGLMRLTEHSQHNDLIASGFVNQASVSTIADSSAFSRIVFTCLLTVWLCGWAAYYIVRKFTRATIDNVNTLEHRNRHDQLTGLLNRNGLLENLRCHTTDDRAQQSFTLILVDLADFRYFNDTLGGKFGDEILLQVARRLQRAFDNSEHLARINGDVFCIVSLSSGGNYNSRELARKVKKVVDHTVVIKDIEIDLRCNLGVSNYPEQSADAEDMLRLAGIALNQAKSSPSGLSVYRPESDSHSIRKLSLLTGLRRAIENDELNLVYQPKVNLSSNTLSGVEALVRWTHPVYDSISPLEFVGWAERTGMIDELTQWVLTKADWQASEWHRQGHNIPIAVNLSPSNLHDDKLPSFIEGLVENGHHSAGSLELELTENAVMKDPERALRSMNRLTELGIRIAIDDFGTGLASFSYLHKFPVYNLKIDRAFVSDSEKSPRDEVLLRSMIELGHNLECVVTAEGVEDQPTLELLKRLQCDQAQGYHLCKPTTATGITDWLNATAMPITGSGHTDLPHAA